MFLFKFNFVDTNTGPVLFPATQPGSETSGVVVGASGFGFVPPGANRREYNHTKYCE